MVTLVLRQVHLLKQGLETQVGAIGIKERKGWDNQKRTVPPSIGLVEHSKHGIYLAGGSVVQRSPEGLAELAGKLPGPLLALSIASQMVGGSQRSDTNVVPGRQLRRSF
jgi:hypothetical protein